MHNPQVLTTQDLQVADIHQIMVAHYQFDVAATSLFFTLIFFYFLFRAAVWFLPKFWYLEKQGDKS